MMALCHLAQKGYDTAETDDSRTAVACTGRVKLSLVLLATDSYAYEQERVCGVAGHQTGGKLEGGFTKSGVCG